MTRDILQTVGTTVIIAIVFAFVRLFRDVEQLKTTLKYELEKVRSEVQPVATWFERTSMDALKIATNPTSERLTKLADRYIASIKGDRDKPPLSVQEKQELIDGLRSVMNDSGQHAAKRQSASMSLRFIETREGLTAKAGTPQERQ